MSGTKKIIDNHGRPVNYLRLSVTDRCNLRCFYCMPEEGIKYLPKQALLSYEEMEKMIRVLAGMGISKVRITGGEPFVRKDLVPFLWKISEIPGIEQIHLTTNGVLTVPHIPELKKIGIKSVNLSLDALDKQRFYQITRKDEYDKVMRTFYTLLENDIRLKINAVVMEGQNIEDLIPLAQLAQKHPVAVRFIEEMPFNGEGLREPQLVWNYRKILGHLKTYFPEIQALPLEANATSTDYQIPGFQGRIGIIAAFSRTFCGTCNRIRVTAQGILKTCLYDDGILDLKPLLRQGISEDALEEVFLDAFHHRPKDGFEAELSRKNHHPVTESMSTIGG